MLHNLLDNALDFAPNHAKIWLHLTYVDAQQMMHIQLFNEGPAIPDFALQRIFESYFSLARPVTQQRSSGIGLSIVQQVIEQHHGKISIENCAANQLASIGPHQSGVLVNIQLHKNFT